MKQLRFLVPIITTVVAGGVLAQPPKPPEVRLEPGEFDCSVWDRILYDYVTYEGVDWKAWHQHGTQEIDDFLNDAASYSLRSVMGKEPKIAFLMNIYNAFAVQQILNHYPLDSINEIEGFFDANSISVDGEDQTLDDLAEQVRAIGKPYPQCALALFSGAMCQAPLAPRAYTAANLADQAEACGRALMTEQVETDGKAKKVVLPGIVGLHRDYFEDQPKGLAGAMYPMVETSVLVLLAAPTTEVTFRDMDYTLRVRPPASTEGN